VILNDMGIYRQLCEHCKCRLRYQLLNVDAQR